MTTRLPSLFSRRTAGIALVLALGLPTTAIAAEAQTSVPEPSTAETPVTSVKLGRPEAGPQSNPEVNALLENATTWNVPVKRSEDARKLTETNWTVNGQRTSCTPDEPRTLSRTFQELAAFPFSGPVTPGLIVEGAGVADGDLRVIPLTRAPLRLVSNLDSKNPVVSVDRPGPATLQQAVTALKRDADAQLTGIDVVQADITYVRDEVHSFEEAFLGMGVSLRYQSPSLRARFDSSFKQEQKTEKHSIVVRLVQPMFTLRMDQSDIRRPGDYFARSVAPADVSSLIQKGTISADNIPVVVDTVTYGRVMYFTMTSSKVKSASELEVALDAAWGGFSGSAQLTAKNKSVLSESRVEVLAYGGDQNIALKAIRTGELSRFFASVNTTTATPLSMTMRTLTGGRIEVGDEVTVQSLSCGTTTLAVPYEVMISNLNGFATVYVNGARVKYFANEAGPAKAKLLNLRPGANTLKIDVGDWFPCLDHHIDVEILKGGVRQANYGWAGASCGYTLKWTIDTTKGTVKKL